ncbi:MAG: thioesterase domain-containing protein, partial [Tumebacillaceae bacterium]
NTTFTTCYVVRDVEQFGASVPIGRPIRNTDVYILDEAQQLVPIGVPGELCTGGAGLAYGYLNRPELTEEKFIPHPFSNDPKARLYRTGDLARYLPDGNIEYLGRMDGQVKIRGYRIELGEIEMVLGQHEAIGEVVVIAREDEPGDKRLVAYVVTQPDVMLTAQQMRDFLRGKLPEYMMPSAFVLLPSIPVTPNGKVDRRALPAPEATKQTAEYIAPRNRFELEMSQVWEQVVKHSPIGVTDNFFAIGGDSLKAITLMSLIRKRFELQVPLATLFQTSTIAALCDRLAERERQRSASDGECLVLIQKGHEQQKPPLFLVHPGWGGVLCYATLASLLGEQETVYGVQAVGYETDEPALNSIHEMAERYVEDIMRVAPNGPYRLGGWSMGGLIAVEMARRLEQRGAQVEFVTLIDTPFLGDVEEELPFDPEDAQAVLRSFASIQLPDVDPCELEGVTGEVAYEYLLQAGKVANVYPPGATVEHVKRDLKIYLAHGTATSRYTCTEPIQADLYLFHVTHVDDHVQHRLVTPDEWRPYTTGTLTATTIPGHHLNAVYPPNVAELATKIRNTLPTHVKAMR